MSSVSTRNDHLETWNKTAGRVSRSVRHWRRPFLFRNDRIGEISPSLPLLPYIPSLFPPHLPSFISFPYPLPSFYCFKKIDIAKFLWERLGGIPTTFSPWGRSLPSPSWIRRAYAVRLRYCVKVYFNNNEKAALEEYKPPPGRRLEFCRKSHFISCRNHTRDAKCVEDVVGLVYNYRNSHFWPK